MIAYDDPAALDLPMPYRMPIPFSTPKATPSPPSSGANVAMLASMGISSIGSIVTGIASARAARAQGDYESSIANTNAAIARVKMRQVLEQGDIERSRQNLKTEQTVGALRTAAGASGTDVATGSNALVRIGAVGVGSIDELTVRNNAARQAWGYETEAIQDTYQGQFANLTAAVKSQQSLLTAGLGAVSGPLAIEANYLRWSRSMGGATEDGIPFPNMS